MPRKKTREEFINDVFAIYGNLYNCDKVDYINSRIPVILICSKHGEFSEQPVIITKTGGYACKGCGNERFIESVKKRTGTKESFVNKAIEIHGNKYNYDNVIYKNAKTKIIITCLEHGNFEQIPDDHLRRKGCIKCGGKMKKTTEEFIMDARKIHNDKFNYSKVNYINSESRVIIICPIHGEFEQKANDHLNGGCKKCALIYTSNLQRKTVEEFIHESIEIHGEKYNYDNVDYINANTEVIIVCTDHGEFRKTPHVHLQGTGCPKCCIWRNENECIAIIEEFTGNKFTKIRPKFLKGLELDGYNDELKIAIEYNGEQHYKIVDYFHRNGIYDLLKQVENDKLKKERCEENGIYLIVVPYYIEDKEIFIQEQLDQCV
jgi:hypothetical protein